MNRFVTLCFAFSVVTQMATISAEELPRLTSLSDQSVSWKQAEKPYFVLKRGDVEAVIVDNHAVDDEVLPKHRAGYNGVASQSPSGGGNGNPAWDFQSLFSDVQPGQRYQMIMRSMYIPYESPEQIQRLFAPHRQALAGN